jgi:hypothetical protein
MDLFGWLYLLLGLAIGGVELWAWLRRHGETITTKVKRYRAIRYVVELGLLALILHFEGLF